MTSQFCQRLLRKCACRGNWTVACITNNVPCHSLSSGRTALVGLHFASHCKQINNKKQLIAEHELDLDTRQDKESSPEEEDYGLLDYYINKAEQELDLVDEAEYFDVLDQNKRVFYKLVDVWLKEAGETKRGHREFITAAMNAMTRFKVEHEISAYLKLLDCFPDSPHTGIKRSQWFLAAYGDKMADHNLGEKLVRLISEGGAIPNEKLFIKATDLFGTYSPVTWSVRSALFWYPRVLQFSKHPIALSKLNALSPVEIAFNGLRQMNPGIDGDYKYFAVDKSQCDEVLNADQVDCVISVQTPDQKTALAKHDTKLPIFIEGPHMVYYKTKTVQYFVMRSDPKALEIKSDKVKILSAKQWWSEMYKTDWKTDKPINEGGKLYSQEQYFPTINLEKNLASISRLEEDISQINGDTEKVEGSVYAIACTDYKSPAALQSWMKGLVADNPKLALSTIVFKEEESFLVIAPKEDPNEDDLEGGEDLLQYL